MLTDFYELTMGNGYFQTGVADQICYFDIFFRSVPDGGGFAIAAGLEQVISYIRDLHFDEEDIAYLRSKNTFSEEFLEYLRTFHFTGDIWAVPEGTPIFPREPILTVRAPAIEAQFVETYLLLTLNHQSLIATKSNRIVRAAQGKPVAEFGSRRAQGADGALLGARASYIAGASGTACAMADQMFDTPATGTMAHSWVQMFPDEYTAFKTYCQLYPHSATLLVDTYNVLKSGVPNAIRVFKEVLEPKGITKCGIRLDSGDLAYLSRKAREMLDAAGLTECKIVASNALDEYIIRDLLQQGALAGFPAAAGLLICRREKQLETVVYRRRVEQEGGAAGPAVEQGLQTFFRAGVTRHGGLRHLVDPGGDLLVGQAFFKLEQGVHVGAQSPRQRAEQGDVRAGAVGLPLADGRGRDPQLGGQLFLGEAPGFAQGGDVPADVHVC